MNLKEVVEKIERRETVEDPCIPLFLEGIERGKLLAKEGLGFLKIGEEPFEFHPVDINGITIEIASLSAGNRIANATQNETLKNALIASIRAMRTFSWRDLLFGLSEAEQVRFINPNNSMQYLQSAHSAALEIVSTRKLEARDREMRLRIGIPPRLNIMQSIRQGALSF
ncbi:MAG: hypothetical protein ACM3IJ_05405 [Candidatus Levyibacteriota bacterium]